MMPKDAWSILQQTLQTSQLQLFLKHFGLRHFLKLAKNQESGWISGRQAWHAITSYNIDFWNDTLPGRCVFFLPIEVVANMKVKIWICCWSHESWGFWGKTPHPTKIHWSNIKSDSRIFFSISFLRMVRSPCYPVFFYISRICDTWRKRQTTKK